MPTNLFSRNKKPQVTPPVCKKPPLPPPLPPDEWYPPYLQVAATWDRYYVYEVQQRLAQLFTLARHPGTLDYYGEAKSQLPRLGCAVTIATELDRCDVLLTWQHQHGVPIAVEWLDVHNHRAGRWTTPILTRQDTYFDRNITCQIMA